MNDGDKTEDGVTGGLLANNEGFAEAFDRGHLDVAPSLHLAVVACMDSRLDVFATLGLNEGQAHIVLRTRAARQVTIDKQRFRLALELHVEDNGPGVPPEIRERIFYPLVSGREGGSGLGLTLAQDFIQQHHGMIECESESGRTLFRILIPLP
jgi:signal transduction histidine kinase